MQKTMQAFVMKRIGEVGLMEKPVPEDPGWWGRATKSHRNEKNNYGAGGRC